ncbi:MAG TPA: type I restriction enzyme HsdR N-terminal domain-containing protein [Flavisolibacter sp.]
MIDVQFPAPRFRIRSNEDKDYIFDEIRRTWILLTEEEWVRQNFIRYLVETMQYPATLIALEKEIRLHDIRKRFDILVYDRQHAPWMLVECKEPAVRLNEDVLQQVLRYNISVPVTYIVITNGSVTKAWKKQQNELVQLATLPSAPA